MKLSINNFQTAICFLVISVSLIKNTPAQNNLSLRDSFRDHFLIGVALNPSQFTEENKNDIAIVKKHFNSVTPENILKWEWVHPYTDKYEFDLSDRFVEFGEKENMFIVGHTLIWHNQTPDLVFKNEEGDFLNREELLNLMQEHIQTVVGRYKGRIHGWDVVNEALDEDGKLKETLWKKIIGEDYVAKAFEYTCQADSDAELYYNDFSLENAPKRKGAVELIKKLLAQGIKIDGVGLQGHYKMDWPSTQQIDSTIKAFADLGLKVMVTELDVDVLPYKNIGHSADINLNIELNKGLNPYKNGLPDSVEKSLADRYSKLFKVIVENSDNISRVTFWGVTDRDSWLNNWPVTGRTNYPLLFDRKGNQKPAYYAVIKMSKKNVD